MCRVRKSKGEGEKPEGEIYDCRGEQRRQLQSGGYQMMMREHRTAEEQREGSCRARELKKDRGGEGRKLRLRIFIPL